MIVIKFKKHHLVLTVWTFQRIITERGQNSSSPLIEAAINVMLAFRNGTMEPGINLTVAGVKAAIPDHFEMFFWYMSDQPLNEFYGRNRFFYVLIIFMPVVMEGNHFAIIIIDSGSANNRTAKIAPDIFHNDLWITEVWLCINIKSLFVFPCSISLSLF